MVCGGKIQPLEVCDPSRSLADQEGACISVPEPKLKPIEACVPGEKQDVCIARDDAGASSGAATTGSSAFQLPETNVIATITENEPAAPAPVGKLATLFALGTLALGYVGLQGRGLVAAAQTSGIRTILGLVPAPANDNAMASAVKVYTPEDFPKVESDVVSKPDKLPRFRLSRNPAPPSGKAIEHAKDVVHYLGKMPRPAFDPATEARLIMADRRPMPQFELEQLEERARGIIQRPGQLPQFLADPATERELNAALNRPLPFDGARARAAMWEALSPQERVNLWDMMPEAERVKAWRSMTATERNFYVLRTNLASDNEALAFFQRQLAAEAPEAASVTELAEAGRLRAIDRAVASGDAEAAALVRRQMASEAAAAPGTFAPSTFAARVNAAPATVTPGTAAADAVAATEEASGVRALSSARAVSGVRLSSEVAAAGSRGVGLFKLLGRVVGVAWATDIATKAVQYAMGGGDAAYVSKAHQRAVERYATAGDDGGVIAGGAAVLRGIANFFVPHTYAELRIMGASISGNKADMQDSINTIYDHDRDASLEVRRGLPVQMRAVLTNGVEKQEGNERDFPEFYQKVDLYGLSHQIALGDDTNALNEELQQLTSAPGFAQKPKNVQEQEIDTLVHRMIPAGHVDGAVMTLSAVRLQQSLAALVEIRDPDNDPVRAYAGSDGEILSGKEDAFLAVAYPDHTPEEARAAILDSRKMALITRIMDETRTSKREELVEFARKVGGIVDNEGKLLETPLYWQVWHARPVTPEDFPAA